MDGTETPAATTSISATPMRREDWLTYLVVLLLLAAAAYRLEVTIDESRSLFVRGIDIIERAFSGRAIEPALASQQIFTLTAAHEVVTFRATALFIGAIVSVLGALFVLRAGEVAYRASLEGAGWKLSLGTSSPGLVMITLGCALILGAILARSHIENAVPVAVGAQAPAADIQKYRTFLDANKPKSDSPPETPNE